MEAKMLEKWTQDGAWFSTHDGRRYYAGGQADAKVFVEAANGAIDQAFAAGLEAGKTQAATKPSEPAPMVDVDPEPQKDMTDAEKLAWAHVYSAVLNRAFPDFEVWEARDWACLEADAAISALRARSAPGEVARLKPQNDGLLDHCIAIEKNAKQVQFELNQAQTRIAELETQLAAARQGAEINRAEGAKAERERCAGIAKAMGDGAESRMKMGSDSRDAFDEGVSSTSKVILRRILNPTK